MVKSSNEVAPQTNYPTGPVPVDDGLATSGLSILILLVAEKVVGTRRVP